jgi:hypothetical protein
MGMEKHEIEMREQRWTNLAHAENYRCSYCSTTIPYGDRETFFKTGMCAHCENILNKDDEP